MDQTLIGKFIADERKKKGYSQAEFGKKLGVSNKTISKWETGRGFPDISLLLPLCDELEISVNELLSAERLDQEEYEKRAEINMVAIINENKKLSKNESILCASTILFMVVSLIGGQGMWMVFGIGAIITAILNVVFTVLHKDTKWFGFISLSLTTFTLCDFYSQAADWVIKEDWSALMDVLPSVSNTLWFLSIMSVIINSVTLLFKKN